MVLVPLFIKWLKIDDKNALATSLCVMIPLSFVSVIVYSIKGTIDYSIITPFAIGGFIGGIIAGKFFTKVPSRILKKTLAIMIIYAGVRSVFLI